MRRVQLQLVLVVIGTGTGDETERKQQASDRQQTISQAIHCNRASEMSG